MRITIKRTVFNDHFLPLLDNEEDFVLLLIGGASSGKSYWSFQRAIYRCFKDKRKYLILRKHAVDVRRSCWEDVKSILIKWKLLPYVKVNSTLMTVSFPNGSEMLFSGCDDVEKLKSIPGVTDAILEEASEFSPVDFDQVKIRLRGVGVLKNQIVLMTNPISKANWIYTRFFKDGNQEPNSLIDRSTYLDNPHVNQETIDALQAYKRTNPIYYKVYCLGEFGSLSKQVFSNWRSEPLDMMDLFSRGYEPLNGLDFGFAADPTAIVSSLLDEDNKRIYVYREFCRTGLLNNDIADVLTKLGLSKSQIMADSAEPKSIEEIKRLGVRRIQAVQKGPDSIRAGIQKLQQYELVVDPSCLNLLEELENYSYKKDRSTGEYLNEPVDAFNHCIDALRYSLQCVSAKPKLRTLPKNAL